MIDEDHLPSLKSAKAHGVTIVELYKEPGVTGSLDYIEDHPMGPYVELALDGEYRFETVERLDVFAKALVRARVLLEFGGLKVEKPFRWMPVTEMQSALFLRDFNVPREGWRYGGTVFHVPGREYPFRMFDCDGVFIGECPTAVIAGRSLLHTVNVYDEILDCQRLALWRRLHELVDNEELNHELLSACGRTAELFFRRLQLENLAFGECKIVCDETNNTGETMLRREINLNFHVRCTRFAVIQRERLRISSEGDTWWCW